MSTSTSLNPPQPAEPATQPGTPAGTTPDAPDATAGRKRRLIPIAAIAALVIVGLIVWRVFFATPALPDSVVAVSGRIEGDDSAALSGLRL